MNFVLNNELMEYKQLNGVDYLVVKTIAQEVGVANDILYSSDFLISLVKQMNSIPITNNHPHLSVGSPDVFEEFSVGTTFDSIFEDNKLKTYIWINIERDLQLESKIVERLENGIEVAVSTGLFFTAKDETGIFNDKKYYGVAEIPGQLDHLAVLSEGVNPACETSYMKRNEEIINKNKTKESKFMKDEFKENEEEVVENNEVEEAKVEVEETKVEVEEAKVEETKVEVEEVEEVVENNEVEEAKVVENEQIIMGDEEVYSYIEKIGNIEIQRVLKESVNLYINTKKEQIKKIIENSEYSEELLKGKSDVELKIIENMLKVDEVEVKQDFSGLNLNKDEVKEVSNVMPSIDWS